MGSDTTYELMSLATQQLEKLQKQAAFAKRAFVPAGGGAPPPGDPAAGGMPPPGMDPAAMGGMPPPGMDPAAMGGMPPPGMDPAAMGGAPPPTTGDPNAAMMAGDPSGGAPPPGIPPEIMQQIVSAVTAQMGGGAAGGAPGAPGAAGKPAKFDPAILDQKMDRLLLAITELMKSNNKMLPPEALLAGTKHAPQGDPAAGGGAPGGAGGSAEPKLAHSRPSLLAAALRNGRGRN